jgi:hypothetical protein
MSEEVIPQGTVADGAHVTPPEGEGADESRISLEDLNNTLGRDYKDVDTALKSVKETYTFIGKRDDLRQGLEQVMEATGQDEQTVLDNLQKFMSNQEPQVEPQAAQPEANPEIESLKQQLSQKDAQYAEDRFFDKNADYESVRNIIKPLKGSSEEFQNMSWDEFKETDVVKNVFETYATANEAQSKKSVVESNPRLGAASDKMNNARQALEQNNEAEAKAQAVSAVTDLLEE